jgi:hypothetical protein
MALPKAVQKQAEEVAAYDKAMEEAANAAQPQPPESTETPPQQPALAAVEPPASIAPAPVTPPVEPQRDDGQWEQKYRTLQGMFARETGNLRTELRQSNERIDALQQQLQNRQQQPATPPEPKAKLVTEKDSEAFGADLIDMARRVAREEFGEREDAYIQRIETLTTQLTQQVGQVRETQYATSRDQFFGTLAAAFPNWEAVQASEACQKWLGSKVPGANFLWNDMLVDAAEKLDSARAIEVFQAFAQTQPRAPQPAPAATGRKSELSRQVTPAKSGGAASVPNEKRTYTAKEYEAESMQIVRLTKAGRHDEAMVIENELNAALLEGRLKP